jgi:hypothetical protein
MADGRYTIHPPLDAERIISSQLLDHGVVAANGAVIPDPCRVCGRLRGQTITDHQARVIRNRLIQMGGPDERRRDRLASLREHFLSVGLG